jgi:putative transposase
MSLPREIVPGASHSVNRRCTLRSFLLLPKPYVKQVFEYCLAHAAKRYNVLIHAYEVLSDHFHLALTDPDGCLPQFMQLLDSLVARALNAHWGRWESFFAPGSYRAVRLWTPEDLLSQIAYILTNAVAAGLVDRTRRWTGAHSYGWAFGETRTFERPSGDFFDGASSLPEEVSLKLTRPPCLKDLTYKQLDERVRRLVIERETEIRAKFRTEGRSFLGMDRVLRFKPEDRAKSRERRRGINPRVAAKDKQVRVDAIEHWSAFVSAYREAWLAWRGGNHSVVFPAGTWLMRVRHRAACRPFASTGNSPLAPS